MAGKERIYLGDTQLHSGAVPVDGEMVTLDGDRYFKISNFDSMPDFFMSLVGPGDHWMFISSNGGLTAGRRDPKNALFPYVTDDKITDSYSHTGSKSIFRVRKDDRYFLWEPFSGEKIRPYETERNIYKSIYGNVLRFEEINRTLGVSFHYSWQFSKAFGFIKTSALLNLSEQVLEVITLDGLQNILPYGVDEGMQLQYSTLVDAYKRSELDPDTGMGIYGLSSVPTDRAEPSEGLKATVVWSAGMKNALSLLSSVQLEDFREGLDLSEEKDIKARRGAYFISSNLKLDAGDQQEWMIVAELEQDKSNINSLKKKLQLKGDIRKEVEKDLLEGTEELIHLVSRADGFQLTNDELVTARHYSNVLYNCMRGGIIADGSINRDDLLQYLMTINHQVFNQYRDEITSSLPEIIKKEELTGFADALNDSDLWRLCAEYLPLTYSRRHGDPSRPWNRFYINNQHPDGSPRIDYQGNWRDIFQNWEALVYSYPEYLDGMICRFVNASTADGFNPYRIMRSGIDWEVIDPDDPWSNIGYWGDHQIIYLLKLMEAMEGFFPGRLKHWLNTDCFVYTRVPYRILNLDERLKNPQNTIAYDDMSADECNRLVEEWGADGKLIRRNDDIYRVNLTEKLLIPVLAKISNLVPEGGIWMNTQRPEWNDANNALVGNGLSMVTVYYLRRHLTFIRELISSSDQESFTLSEEVGVWTGQIRQVFSDNLHLLDAGLSAEDRGELTRALGRSFDAYLEKIWSDGFTGNKLQLDRKDLTDFLTLVLSYIDASIKANHREDDLFHAYNLMSVAMDGSISVKHLQEMLEGQVAVLSSGYLDAGQAVDLLKALRTSTMYREDQQSYTLYPDKDLPGFMVKNRIEEEEIRSFSLLKQCIDRKDHRLVKPDEAGGYQFNGDFKNSADLLQRLESMRSDYGELIDAEREGVKELFEDIFDHHSFTGRSGTFFKYEGLGSIYWHMVSKLILAIGELIEETVKKADPADHVKLQQLTAFYNDTKQGLGLHKSPEDYGAFPTDPYSHTPMHAGVQQPGMTGQVKEDILSRWMELGLEIKDGSLKFNPFLLTENEFLKERKSFSFFGPDGRKTELDIPQESLAFTYCLVPVIYSRSEQSLLRIRLKNGEVIENEAHELSADLSSELFRRSGKIVKIEVFFKKD